MEFKENKKKQTVFKENGEFGLNSGNEKQKTSSGLEQNIAGFLCYLGGFITGVIFLFIEKENRFVRYHAIQSILVTAALLILSLVLTIIPVIGWIISLLLIPVYFILWIYMMFKAYKNTWFKFPIVGDIAEKQLEKLN